MICFHGTTTKGLQCILDNVGSKPFAPWVCSEDDGMMYVYPLNKVAENHCTEDEEETISRGLDSAFESAQIQCAIAQEETMYVLVLDIPDNLLEDDCSCENMSDVASMLEMTEFNTSMVKSVYECSFNKWYAPFVLVGILDNPQFNVDCLDKPLLDLAERLRETEYFMYELLEFDYTNVTETVLNSGADQYE